MAHGESYESYCPSPGTLEAVALGQEALMNPSSSVHPHSGAHNRSVEEPVRYLGVTPAAIPPALRTCRQWLCWRAEQRGDRVTKVPVQPDGTPASTTNRATWHAFEEVLDAYHAETCSGIGFVLTPPWCGVDFDHCLGDDGTLDPAVAAWVQRFASYAEVSVSGTGLHVFCTAELPPFGRRRGQWEAYNDSRYFTVTGQRWPDTPEAVTDATAVVRDFRAVLGADQASVRHRASTLSSRPSVPDTSAHPVGGTMLTYLESTGPLHYPSPSEADAAAAAALIARGYTAAEALALLRDSPRGQDALRRKGRHGLAYLERTVEHAAQHVGAVVIGRDGQRVRRLPAAPPAPHVRRLDVPSWR